MDGRQDRIEPWSMRPFVEGLAELHNARLIYRTFTTGEELKELISYQAVDDSTRRTIVYIVCHGRGGRLVPGRNPRQLTNVASIADVLRAGVEGVWLGACDVGNSGALTRFFSRGGALWSGGYRCAVDWDASLLIDLAILREALLSGPIQNRETFLRTLVRAFRGFNPDWIIGEDADGERVSLDTAIRVMARDKTPGSRPRDITHDLRTKLRWHDGGVNSRDRQR